MGSIKLSSFIFQLGITIEKGIFGKDPFLRMLYSKMAPNPIISQIYILVTSHFRTLLTKNILCARTEMELRSINTQKRTCHLYQTRLVNKGFIV